MSNIQAAQPAAHSVPNSNGGQPQYIAPVDHVPQIPASAYSHPGYSSNPAEKQVLPILKIPLFSRGYTMQLPHGTQIIGSTNSELKRTCLFSENRIQTGSGNHNVVTVFPQNSLPHIRGQPPRMPLMNPQGPQGHPQQPPIPYSSAPNTFFYP